MNVAFGDTLKCEGVYGVERRRMNYGRKCGKPRPLFTPHVRHSELPVTASYLYFSPDLSPMSSLLPGTLPAPSCEDLYSSPGSQFRRASSAMVR